MNRLTLYILVGLLLILTPQVVESQEVGSEQTFQLKDGTILKGTLRAVEGETYVIETTNLGTFNIRSNEITSITNGQPPIQQQAAPMGGNPGLSPGQGNMGLGMMGDGDIGSATSMMAQQFMNDPQVMSSVQEIANDPEVMRLMQDGTFMQMLMGMNSGQIENDPRFQKLMQNPQMRALMEMMSQKISGQSGMNFP